MGDDTLAAGTEIELFVNGESYDKTVYRDSKQLGKNLTRSFKYSYTSMLCCWDKVSNCKPKQRMHMTV